jgi:uncharacterized LabA/DUF88 family protein
MANQAFIDAQNIHLGTTTVPSPWRIDLKKLRVYLSEKYDVTEAYYFLGSYRSDLEDMYLALQKNGYLLAFREHSEKMVGKKKGNADTDIVFCIMRKLYKRESFDRVVLASGDGDYYRLVRFLIEEEKFEKLLMPCRRFASSLYRTVPERYKDFLDNEGVKHKIEFQKKKNAGSP